MAKMWAGRFSKEVDEKVNDFNSSISFDARMYRHDIRGSMAHAQMLGEQGIIEKHESEKIIEGLKGILADIDSGIVEWGVQVTAEVPTKSVATVTRNTTGTIEGKLQIGHLDVLSLMYGMRITNNWLKMHGGIMARNGGKKKKRRLF